jgi:hypothetical protein
MIGWVDGGCEERDRQEIADLFGEIAHIPHAESCGGLRPIAVKLLVVLQVLE